MKTLIKSCLAIICLSACVLGLIVPVSAADLSQACRISPSSSLRWNSRESLAGEITVQVNPEQKGFYQAAADRVIKENPGVKITLIEMEYKSHLNKLFDEAVATSVIKSDTELTDALEEKLQLSEEDTVSETADLFMVSVASFRDLAKAGIIAPLEIDILLDEGVSTNSEAYDNSLGGIFKVGQDYYACPFGIETMIALLNTANAEEQDFDFEESIEISNLTQAEQFILPLSDFNCASVLLNSAELRPLYVTKTKGDKFAIASDLTYSWDSLPENMKELFSDLYTFYQLQKCEEISLHSEDKCREKRNTAFISGGKSILAFCDSAKDAEHLADLANKGKDLKYLPLSQVKLNGQALMHWKGGWGLSLKTTVLENPEKKAIAEAMIRELTNPDFAEDLYLQSGTILDTVSPEVYSESKSLEDSQKEIIALSLASFEEAQKLPTVPGFDKVWGTWENGLSSWTYLDVQNAKEAYEVLQVRFVNLLKQLSKKGYKAEIYSVIEKEDNESLESKNEDPDEALKAQEEESEAKESEVEPKETEAKPTETEPEPTETQEEFAGEYSDEDAEKEPKESTPPLDDEYSFVDLDAKESIPHTIKRYAKMDPSFKLVDNTIEDLEVLVEGEEYTISGYYKGETDEDNLPHGFGEFVSDPAAGARWSYKGEWNHGVMEGEGISIWAESGDLDYLALRGFYSKNVMIYGGSVQTYKDGSWESSEGSWRYENNMPILSAGIYSSMLFQNEEPVYKAYDTRGEVVVGFEPLDNPAGQWKSFDPGSPENYQIIDGPPDFWPIDYTE